MHAVSAHLAAQSLLTTPSAHDVLGRPRRTHARSGMHCCAERGWARRPPARAVANVASGLWAGKHSCSPATGPLPCPSRSATFPSGALDCARCARCNPGDPCHPSRCSDLAARKIVTSQRFPLLCHGLCTRVGLASIKQPLLFRRPWARQQNSVGGVHALLHLTNPAIFSASKSSYCTTYSAQNCDQSRAECRDGAWRREHASGQECCKVNN
jgi:hypothetical protein